MFCADRVAEAAHDLDQAQKDYLAGRYQSCISTAQVAIAERAYQEDWRHLLVRCYLDTGQYAEALVAVSNALPRFSNSIRMQSLARTVFLFNSRPERAEAALQRIFYLAQQRSWAYRDAPSLVAFGQAALQMGADARRVLEQSFDVAKSRDPKAREAYLAIGQLALDKHDYQLAARLFGEGIRVLPEDPDLHYGLARAFEPSDRAQMLASLDTALSINTNHVPSYVLLADHLVDGEEYAAATETLNRALAVHPWHPEAWAYRAVIAHLHGERLEESRFREKALAFWTNNPAVDHLIGRKLSQKYRFREGADCQRRALAHDPDYLPAKIQLAQDLLRLGRESEGWRLAAQVHAQDSYDVGAFNLLNLKDVLDRFTTLTNEHFLVRMEKREAAIYGVHALALLLQAHDHLCAKYGLDLKSPTTVEIFPDQKDFGVRTFGMPGNPGFLGVCFGPVITANSPAAQMGSPHNWKAVLWHEFCHVVTLHLTQNKMPRWLSEGLSVYEERQANPAWGQLMNPRYRSFILAGDLTPVGELSAAFLAPKSDLHLQFAYFQSYLVVDFLVRRFGLEQVRRILNDLAQDVDINTAITRHTAPLEEIERQFEKFARQQAQALGPGLDWAEPAPAELAEEVSEQPAEASKNFYVLMGRARQHLQNEQWAQAKETLQFLLEHYPDQRGPDSAYLLLAEAQRGLNETEAERGTLGKLALLDAEAVDAFARLMELDRAQTHWEGVLLNAQRYLAVNPLVSLPHQLMAEAAEALGQVTNAIAACQALLLLDPDNPADVHFRLARLLHQAGNPTARRHVLQALEEAPRFRAAHRLLLQIIEDSKPESSLPSPGPSAALPPPLMPATPVAPSDPATNRPPHSL